MGFWPLWVYFDLDTPVLGLTHVNCRGWFYLTMLYFSNNKAYQKRTDLGPQRLGSESQPHCFFTRDLGK
jgi:hypothetical protein